MKPFDKATWIGFKKGEDFPLDFKIYTRDKESALKETLPVYKGSVLFRHEFALTDKIGHASLQICGLGFYEVYINGQMPDEKRVLTPAVSDYFVLTRYDTYDVTALVRGGMNTLCAEVGPGWYSGSPKYWGWQQTWYGNPRLIAALTVTYENGSTETVVTDPTWKLSQGMITSSCVYDGETWDFNRRQNGWMDIGFDDATWQYAEEVNAPTENLVESIIPPERIIRTLKPVRSWNPSGCVTAFDFGENGSGMPRVTVKGKKGDVIEFHHAEFICEDGQLDPTTLSFAQSHDTYILANDQPTVCTVKFTWHGYQYMTVTVSSPDVLILDAEKCVVHSDVRTIGTFTCGKPGFNRFHEGAIRTELACLQGVPVDCPQREERKAWLGDAHVTSELCFYNFDMDDFYRSFLEDMRIGRPEDTGVVTFLCPCYNYNVTIVKYGDRPERTSIDWNMAYPIILSEHYQRCGDISILQHHYSALKEHTDYYVGLMENGLIPFCWFGDWLTFDYKPGEVNRVAFDVGPDYHRQNPPYAATLFFCTTLRILIETASILGDHEDVAYYSTILETSKQAICDGYYHPETGILGSGGQFLQAYALSEHIVPETDREKAFAQLVNALEELDCHLICGIIGYRVMFDVLDSFDRRDLIYRILDNEGYLCPQHFLEGGHNTLPENHDWTGSGCHCMWGSPDTAFYKIFGGITVDRRREHAVFIRPYFHRALGFVECEQQIAEGTISVKWTATDDGYQMTLVLPTEAVVTLPEYGSRILAPGTYEFHITA